MKKGDWIKHKPIFNKTLRIGDVFIKVKAYYFFCLFNLRISERKYRKLLESQKMSNS